jgi:peroxiredoxin Q/BCP
MSPARGERAPGFEAETTQGRVRLETLLHDGPLVLVFYVEDGTPACTAQLCAFRDEYQTLRELGARVLAVSTDGMGAHEAFARRNALPFVLATDVELQIARAYDVVDEDGKHARRAVFVIGGDGTVLEALVPYQPGVADQFMAVFRALGFDG